TQPPSFVLLARSSSTIYLRIYKIQFNRSNRIRVSSRQIKLVHFLLEADLETRLVMAECVYASI
ncbi:MAG: hypothetical protein K8F91_20225, partial [Candidatus Obscuribacterales bacterium]|nr:hypothetical protein [Candidatus Obscuribacterales bacterium]